MKTLKITKADLDGDNFYIGKEDFSEYSKKYDGNIEIDGGLGTVRFKKGVHASYSIVANASSGISAGGGISAGYGISAGDGISAGSGISAGYGISANLELSARLNIFAGVSRYINAQGEYKKITCGKLVDGKVCYGDLIETGVPNELKETITIGGIKYDKKEVEEKLKDIKAL